MDMSPLSPQMTPSMARGSLAAGVPLGVSREEEAGRAYSTKKSAFHEVFNLSENERPLPGGEWNCNERPFF